MQMQETPHEEQPQIEDVQEEMEQPHENGDEAAPPGGDEPQHEEHQPQPEMEEA